MPAAGGAGSDETPGVPVDRLAAGLTDEQIEDRRRWLRTGSEVDRTIFFADAVFAIAMTLLVLDLRLPEGLTTADALDKALLDALPSFLGFVISFAIIATIWLTHHRRFRGIVRFDGGLQILNLAVLFFVALMPVSTGMLFTERVESPWPSLIYSLDIIGAYTCLILVWWHARRANLLDPRITPAVYRAVQISMLPLIAVFLLSIPIAFFSANLATEFWIVLWPVSVFWGRHVHRKFVAEERADIAAGRSPAHLPAPIE